MKQIIGYHLTQYGRINPTVEKTPITFQSRSDYAVIEDRHGFITLSRNAQRKLYEILKKRFDK